MHSSTCGGRNELCHGRGPAWPDDSASTAIIAQRQADKAAQLFQAPPGVVVSGPIDYRHIFINMSDTLVSQ
jgi:neutral ceramidase